MDRESNDGPTYHGYKHSQTPDAIMQALPTTSMDQSSPTVTESLPSWPPVMSRLERRMQESTQPGRAHSDHPRTNGNTASPAQTNTPTPVLNLDTTTTDMTPQQPHPSQTSDLHQIPELATAYIPRTSMLNSVEYSNPQKFTLNPPFWTRWSAKRYSDFAAHLSQQFDPVPFAQEQNIPVEEVQHVFTSLVTRPLGHARESARRGEEGMREVMDLVTKFGSSNRRWGRAGEGPGDEPVYGALAGIEKQTVVLTTEVGFQRKLRLDQLSGADIEVLQSQLLEQDRAVFWDCEEEVEMETNLEVLKEKYGSQTRHWGAPRAKDGKRLFGSLVGTKRGSVLVQTTTAGREPYEFSLKFCVDADERCLTGWLSMAEQKVLRAEGDAEAEEEEEKR